MWVDIFFQRGQTYGQQVHENHMHQMWKGKHTSGFSEIWKANVRMKQMQWQGAKKGNWIDILIEPPLKSPLPLGFVLFGWSCIFGVYFQSHW